MKLSWMRVGLLVLAVHTFVIVTLNLFVVSLEPGGRDGALRYLNIVSFWDAGLTRGIMETSLFSGLAGAALEKTGLDIINIAHLIRGLLLVGIGGFFYFLLGSLLGGLFHYARFYRPMATRARESTED